MSTDAWTGLRAAGLACGAAAMLAACFSERSNGPAGAGGECSIGVAEVGAGHVLVAMAGFAFTPDSIHVPVGATVTWVDCEPAGTEEHTTTSDVTGWDSGLLVTGQRFSHSFPAPGTFPYHCSIHPGMIGKVVVQ